MANRYQELLEEIPKGTYYVASGEILPKRSSPYEFLFPTGLPNRRFGVFVNDVFRGIVDTDANGDAIVEVTLDVGRQIIVLRDETTQALFHAYVTIKTFATWLVAHADVFESIDDKITQMRESLSLRTASSLFVEDVYGRALQQPNDVGYLIGAYRFALEELRQAYRLWGARPAGLRQAVHALTSVNPLRIPRAWRPNWILDDQLAANNEFFDITALFDSVLFPNLNARAANWVRGSFADNVSPVPSPFTSPPDPQPLTVTFDAAWVAGAAGDVVIDGLDESGREITDTFVVPGAAGTVSGLLQERFADITAVRLTTLGAGAGTATIGLLESRFIKFVSAMGPWVPAGGSLAHTVLYLSAASISQVYGVLELGGGPLFSLSYSGRYRLPGNFGYFVTGGAAARIDGIVVVAPAATVNYGTRNRLHVRIDKLGVVVALLPTAPANLTAIAAAINAALAREETLGATRASGNVTIVNPANILEGDIITITDGLGGILVLEADTDNTVTAGRVPFLRTGTATQVAAAIRDRINLSGVFENAQLAAPGSAVCDIRSAIGGTSSNVAITTTIAAGGATVAGMAGGTNADAQYLNRAAVITNAGPGTEFLQLLASIGSIGPVGSAEILPFPVSAAVEAFGFPRRRAALSAPAAALATSLTCATTGTDRLPLVPTIVVHASLASSVQNAPGPFRQPEWATALEVWFSPDYDGGDVIIDGVDCEGTDVLEEFDHAPSIADQGLPGTGQFQIGGRAANSPGTLGTIDLGDASGVNQTIRVWNARAPGAPGNAWDAQVVILGPNQPLIVSVAGTTLTVSLATDGAGAPIPALNLATTIRPLIEAQGFFAAFTGTGVGAITVAEPLANFAGGVNGGQVVQLTKIAGATGLDFASVVKPGMFLRIRDGALAGQMRRIAFVGVGANIYPPNTYSALVGGIYDGDVIKLFLESSFGASFVNASWEIRQAVVVKGSVLFKTIVSAANDVAGTAGRWQVRIRDGVEDYGVPIRVGRGSRASGADGQLTAPFSSVGDTGAFQAASLTPSPDDFQGIVRITNAAAIAGANNGMHTVYRMDPSIIGVTPGQAFLKHEHWQRGRGFRQAPNTPTDWSSFIAETALAWELYIPGELVVMVRNDRTTDVIEIAEPGLNIAKISGAFVEDAGELPVLRQGREEGLDVLAVDVDLRLLPSGASVNDSVTARARSIPDGWRTRNVDEANCLVCIWGFTNDLRLRLQGNGGAVFGGGIMLERDVPRAVEYRGLTLNVTFWMEQTFGGGEGFRVDVSFDGSRTFSLGPVVVVPQSGTDAGAAGYGGGSPTPVTRTVEVPTDAVGMIIRLRHNAATTNGQRIFVEKVIVEAVHAQGLFLGSNTIARHETHQQFGELLYVWSPLELTEPERRNLGVPELGSHAATVEIPGHIDRIVNAHGYWERIDVSEYAAGGAPINVAGIYDDADWLLCTLVNMILEVQTPARLSFVRPSRVSLIEGEELTITAPSNATLANTSRHEGLFPQAAELRDRLYQDGIPVPDTSFPGTRATRQIGTALGVNGTILVTVDTPGIAGNAHTISVDAAVGTDRPMRATYDALTGAILVELAARDGALVADENRALLVAQALNALSGITATHLPGNGTAALNAAEGPLAFTGAQATPWRFTAASAVQIASVAAGDAADVANYREGINAAVGATPIFDPTSDYTVDYEVLIRATSPTIDLGASFSDYLWLVDAAIYRRVEPEILEVTRETAVLFRADFTAALDEPATQDQTMSRLFRDNGLVRDEVPVSEWSYIDARNIRLEPSEFDNQAIYTLEYVAETARFPRVAEYVLEHRSATTSGGLTAAVWQLVEIDQPVGRPSAGAHRYHQIRVTITNVLDIRDIRVKTMGLKGIRLYGSDPHAPGIITCDEET